MTTTVASLVPAKYVEAVDTTQYISSGVKTIIDKCTVTNVSASNVTFSANLVPDGGVVGNDNLVIDARAIVPGETYICPELVGQVLDTDDLLSTLASAGSALTLVVSGRIIS